MGQHYDDLERFVPPVVSLRLLGASRLCFGTRFGWVNSAFAVPLPRGTVLCMEDGGYVGSGYTNVS